MVDPATISLIVSIIATLAATASSVANVVKTVVETLEKNRGNGWKPNAESRKVLTNISSKMGTSFQKLDGRNYRIWSTEMEKLLKCYDLWDLVEEGYKEKGLKDKASKKDREKDFLITVILLIAVDESVSHCVLDANNSKEAWDAIKTQYKGKSLKSYFCLRCKS
ncbi:PREDICTED: uncharacterized protein LOC109161107 [Ipomoea nil]|uniref:uncharacterized protein LOC109161107 n=1 Tax=Ipomoea nil TaxID=35883 RepID=UPI0009011C17|nr:PREDICTED: uncharacterized protein LOC109161107 [Ipomoea nil]